MGIAIELWEENKDIAKACLNLPFVRGIEDGSLSHRNFAYYIGQDAFYLEELARVYSIIAAKVPDLEGFRVLHRLVGETLKEREMHEAKIEEWGVDMDEEEPCDDLRRYTDFLLATAWAKSPALAIIATGPCMRTYPYIARRMARDGIPDHAYSDWIRKYSDPSVDELVQVLDDLIDRYDPPEEEAHKIYTYAMWCEYEFFAKIFFMFG